MGILHILNDPSENRTFQFDKDIVYVGRSSGNDIRINEKHISRTHLKITRKGGKYAIEHLGSGNGTYVNGELIPPNKECEVNPSDPVRIACNTLIK